MKKIVESINNNIYFKKSVLALLFLSTLLISFENFYFNVIAIIFLVFILLIQKPEELICSYIFLFFFETVTEISFLGGSINRIVTVIGLLKILYIYYRERTKINRNYFALFCFFLVFLIYSFLINNSYIIKNFVLFLNITFFIIYGNYFSNLTIKKKKNLINDILRTIVYGTVGSIIYGFLTWNFMAESRAGFINYRFMGTSDPNFLAYYVNLALIIQIFNNKKIFTNKYLNVFVYIVLICGLILGKSVTGITINIITVTIAIFINQKEKIKNYYINHKRKVLTSITCFFLVISILCFLIVKKNLNEVHLNENNEIVANNRISDILLSIKKMDINRLTSQKTYDWMLYINTYKKDSLIVKAFGHGIQPIFIYNPYFEKESASHSTYIDILFCYGAIGLVIIGVYIYKKVKNGIILNKCIDNKCLNFIRIVLLIYGLQLGIYTNRIVLMMFLL